VPLSDRDYMHQQPRQSNRRPFKLDLGMNPIWALIIANVALFLAVQLSSNSLYPFGPVRLIETDRFTYYLGLIPYYFTDRPWTLVTAMLIHSGFGHIFGNIITLFFFGMFFNRLVGGGRFLLVYFIGGIVGNLAYLLLGSDLSVAIGASGAIYAIAGAMVVMVPRLTVNLYFLIPVPLWVVVLVFYVAWSFIPGVAWQAHLGGLAVGLIAGFFFRRRIRYDFYR
jgi:membrane associated rhomboid family serine protease